VLQRGQKVEEGETSRVLSQPDDPYTQRLILAAPVLNPDVQRERRMAWRATVSAPT
jgi:ABC-type oligopeptide transport system ATPase subunit